MIIIEKIGVLDTYNVDNCSKIRDNKNRIQKNEKQKKLAGAKKFIPHRCTGKECIEIIPSVCYTYYK